MDNKLLNDKELEMVVGGAGESSWDYTSEARSLLISVKDQPKKLKAGLSQTYGDHKIVFTDIKYDGFSWSYAFAVYDMSDNLLYTHSESDFIM